jgi:hypothetical protein
MTILYKLRIGFFYSLVFLLFPLIVFAASDGDTFKVSIFLGTDTQAPTVPGNFSVTPISTNQIDLDWDASSDNASVAGYQVFRDALQIATTTLTAYSDTGLSDDTLYTYFVTAFDSSLNISSSTNSLSTSTLAVVVPIATTSTTTTASPSSQAIGSYPNEINLFNFHTFSDIDSVNIFFETDLYTKATIRWGRTVNFESGYVSSESFKKEHDTLIDGLESGVIYQIEIILVDNYGQNTLRYQTQIKTQELRDSSAPQNVSNLNVKLNGNKAYLDWLNPDIEDFVKVRVMSSDYFYPSHTASGWLVYDGPGQSAVDEREIPEGSIRYYTVFVYDDSGNISSGAVTSISNGKVDRVIEIASTTENSPLKFYDLQFEQSGESARLISGEVLLDGGVKTKLSLAYDILPEHLKTIVVILTDPQDREKVFSFLLRVNKDKTAYEALIGPLLKGGLYPVSLEVIDFETKEISKVSGEVTVKQAKQAISKNMLSIPSFIQYDNVFWVLGLILLILLILILVIIKYLLSNKSEDKIL